MKSEQYRVTGLSEPLPDLLAVVKQLYHQGDGAQAHRVSDGALIAFMGDREKFRVIPETSKT